MVTFTFWRGKMIKLCATKALGGFDCAGCILQHTPDNCTPVVQTLMSLGLPDCLGGYIYVLEKKDEV